MIICVMFCWETQRPAFPVDISLTCATYQNMAADQVHLLMVVVFPMAVASFGSIMGPAPLYALFGKKEKRDEKCYYGPQIP